MLLMQGLAENFNFDIEACVSFGMIQLHPKQDV
jgi:hypothetical protein